MSDQQAPRYQGTRIDEPATFRGQAGGAWRVRLLPLGARVTPDHDATVGMFLVRAPGAHPFWDHYAVTMVHLRPIEGVKSPTIRVDGATHELMILSLNPEQPLPGLDAGPDFKVAYLTPFDVVEQFHAANDAVAHEILELVVRNIVDGFASPDQDWRAWWTNAIARTAAHFGDGTHSLGRPA